MSVRAEIEDYAHLLANDIRTGATTAPTREVFDYLVDMPDTALDLVALIGLEARRESPDEALIDACISMFGTAVESARFQVDGGHAWAKELVDSVRRELLALGRDGCLGPLPFMQLVNALVEAKLEPGEALSELLGEMMLDSVLEEEPDADLSDVEALVESALEGTGGDAFDIHVALDDIGKAMPLRLRKAMPELLMRSDNPVLRETVVLSLLDADPEIRHSVCGLIAGRAPSASVSPVSLRRMIAVRNWLLEPERPQLDAAIRKARQSEVESARWPKRVVPEIIATQIDGAGAQSVFAVTKDGSKFLISALLVKQGVGIADAWSEGGHSKGEVRSFLREVQTQTVAHKVPAGYVRLLVSHYLAVGHRRGAAPGTGLLRFAEATGLEDCQPAELAAGDLLAMIEADAAPAELEQAAVDAVLAASMFWPEAYEFMASWFEDDSEVAGLLSGEDGGDVEAVLHEILEPRRAKWTERLLWTALWLKQKRDRHSRWKDVFLVGRELHGGRPVAEIPLMHRIAETTLTPY